MLRAFRFLLLPLLLLSTVSDVAAQRPSSGDPVTFHTLAGHVRYADTNRGAEMLRVELKRFTGENVATAFTGANGEFEIVGVARGNYIISIVADGFDPLQ